MEDLEALRAENERLRELLLDNGISPEPYVPPLPQFGPPTYSDFLMVQTTSALFKIAVDSFLRFSETRKLDECFFSGEAWPPSDALRIRLPVDFNVIQRGKK